MGGGGACDVVGFAVCANQQGNKRAFPVAMEGPNGGQAKPTLAWQSNTIHGLRLSRKRRAHHTPNHPETARNLLRDRTSTSQGSASASILRKSLRVTTLPWAAHEAKKSGKSDVQAHQLRPALALGAGFGHARGRPDTQRQGVDECWPARSQSGPSCHDDAGMSCLHTLRQAAMQAPACRRHVPIRMRTRGRRQHGAHSGAAVGAPPAPCASPPQAAPW